MLEHKPRAVIKTYSMEFTWHLDASGEELITSDARWFTLM
ncbi:MAG: hypothetical protein ACI9JZ_002188 [Lentimonas sp.]|jgi:hypothetical protein